MDIINIVVLLFAGLAGGFLAGLLGIGGGAIYAIILLQFAPELYEADLSQTQLVQLVVANTIFARFFAALSGCWKQYNMDNFHLPTSLALGIPATIITIGLIFILEQINYSKIMFQVVFILIFLPLLYRLFRNNDHTQRLRYEPHTKRYLLYILGIANGLITALAGFGGGMIMVPMLSALFNIKLHKIVSISLTVILIIAFFTTFFNLFFVQLPTTVPYTIGNISLVLSLPMIVGVTLAAPWGVSTSKKLSENTLRKLFIAFCLIMITKTICDLIFT
ncbi:MAG: sulfite exporter TauE/SafE family protein [Chitinophagales bacterium]